MQSHAWDFASNSNHQPKINRFQCSSVDHYKTTLQEQIRNKDWQAVLQTEKNMWAFLEDESNKRGQAFLNEDTYHLRNIFYGVLTFAALIITPRTPRLLIGTPAISLSLYNAVKGITVTPENVYAAEKKWLAKTMHGIDPQLHEFLHHNTTISGEHVTQKHGED